VRIPRTLAALGRLGMAGLAGVGGSSAARADPFDPITDRNFGIDLYQGVAFGSTRVVSMGGAAAALATGSSGTLINVSAPAVRETTDTDSWSWDFHLDFITATLSSDYANTALPGGVGGATLVTGGLSGRVGNWAAAVTTTIATTPLQGASDVHADTARTQFALAGWVPQIDTSIGIGMQNVEFSVDPSGGGPALFSINGTGLEAGATWAPRLEDVRIGANFETPILGTKVTSSTCDPDNCMGFILPDRVVSSWRATAGGAYRWSPTRWNQIVPWKFRDEREVTVAADLVLTGSAADGYGLDAFGRQELQRSGRHTSVSPRAGVEYEWWPGKLRVRGGSYYEPARLEGASGRAHVTFGAEYDLFHFRAWGPRRLELAITGDLAESYRNLGASIGLWH
jgi:hypothetical protein